MKGNMIEKESVDKDELSITDELRKEKKDKKDQEITIFPQKIQDPSVDQQNPMGEKIK